MLTPGVTASPQTASSEDPQGSNRKVVNGQSFAGTTQLLDGTDNHDAMLGLIVINPTLESLSEAKITTSAYDAEFGANAGVISVQTKSGTNDFHAVAFEYLRNERLNARNPFTQFNPIRGSKNRYIPVTQYNQYGGAVSGRIIPNKLFWFADYQGTRRNTGGSVLSCTKCGRTRRRLFGLGYRIFSIRSAATAPARRTQFTGNKIPTARLSPQALNFLNKFIPLPKIDGFG